MSMDGAIEELESVRIGLRGQLSAIDNQRIVVIDELRRVEDALDALRDQLDTGPRVGEHTGKYRALWQSLRTRDDDAWNASFSDVEEVIGFPLPPSCRRHLPHWYGTEGSAVARAIHDAGWKATLVSLEDESVTFRKQ